MPSSHEAPGETLWKALFFLERNAASGQKKAVGNTVAVPRREDVVMVLPMARP